MPHIPSDHIVSRNQKLVEAYRNDPTLSRQTLATEFRVSPQTVERVLRDAGIVQRERFRRQRLEERRPISNLHRCLGAEIEEKIRKNRTGRLTDHALHAGVVSAARLSSILLGLGDITLAELTKLADYVRSTPVELLSAAVEREARICQSLPQIQPKATG